MESSERSFADVLEDIIGNVQRMIRSEVRLAKAEIQEESIKAGKASGLAGSGVVLAIYALGFLFLTCLFALEIAVTPWLAALIMTVLIGSTAAALLRVGIKRIKQVHPRPDKTITSVKENLEWAKNQVK